jgi:hypothetical protein
VNGTTGILEAHLREGHPDFLDLPWDRPLAAWEGMCARLVQVQRGLSRHEVRFVGYGPAVYALKELPPRVAEREYLALRALEDRGQPAVRPVGHVRARPADPGAEESSVLVTRYLEGSVPYRTLFSQPGMERYRERLLDAMASLLVKLHLAGFYWGDCSLSNTLFLRDAGELQATLVDAETSEAHESLSDGQRRQDLMIMEENVSGELADVAAMVELPPPLATLDTAENIRQRYERLWDEVAREELLAPGERWRIHERIRALNELGFSVSEVELLAAGDGERLRMRTIVTDRDYHRRQLHSLTGIVAADRQAALMLNEIRELRATLQRERDRSVPMSVSAHHWAEERWRPTVERLADLVGSAGDAPELYCQLLEHKWYLSERARRDVGLERAIEDFLQRFQGG